MATQKEKLRAVAAMFESFGRLDRDEFVSHLTEDVDFHPSAFVTGAPEMHGREEVRRNLEELTDQLERADDVVRLRPIALYIDRADEDKVLALGRYTVIRPNSDSFDTDVAHLHSFKGDKVSKLETWLDHSEGLRRLEDPEQVPFPN